MTTQPLILVTGATGNTGSGLVPTLLAACARVRALVHTEGKAEALRKQGAEVIVADLGNPAALDAALAGVDRIYLCLFNGPEQANHGRNLICDFSSTQRTTARFGGVRYRPAMSRTLSKSARGPARA